MATSKTKAPAAAKPAAVKPAAKPTTKAVKPAPAKVAEAPAKPAAAKAVEAPAKPAAKSAPAKTLAAARRQVDAEQRLRMIADAAYFIAEKRGFIHGHHDADWAEAERQIDAMLQSS